MVLVDATWWKSHSPTKCGHIWDFEAQHAYMGLISNNKMEDHESNLFHLDGVLRTFVHESNEVLYAFRWSLLLSVHFTWRNNFACVTQLSKRDANVNSYSSQELKHFFFSLDMRQWCDYDLKSKLKMEVRICWNDTWTMACHYLWSWRNKEVYDHDIITSGPLVDLDKKN
jgi:hypothetical protein